MSSRGLAGEKARAAVRSNPTRRLGFIHGVDCPWPGGICQSLLGSSEWGIDQAKSTQACCVVLSPAWEVHAFSAHTRPRHTRGHVWSADQALATPGRQPRPRAHWAGWRRRCHSYRRSLAGKKSRVAFGSKAPLRLVFGLRAEHRFPRGRVRAPVSLECVSWVAGQDGPGSV